MPVEEHTGRTISRVLSSDSHSSRRIIADTLQQPTRTLGGPRQCVLFGLAPNGVWPAAPCCQVHGALLPHLFTLTCAALSDGHRRFCSLFHFPSRCRARPLAGIPPCGARTFLPVCLAAIRGDCLSGLYARRIIAQGGARPSETAANAVCQPFQTALLLPQCHNHNAAKCVKSTANTPAAPPAFTERNIFFISDGQTD